MSRGVRVGLLALSVHRGGSPASPSLFLGGQQKAGVRRSLDFPFFFEANHGSRGFLALSRSGFWLWS